MRILRMVLGFLSISLVSLPLASGWDYDIETGLKMSLSTFSDNWGGLNVGTFVWVSNVDASFGKQINPWLNSENAFNLAFGQTKVQDKTSKKWSSPEVSTDNLNIQTTEKISLRNKLNPCVGLQITSQFFDSDQEDNIRHLNPIELTETIGITRDFGRRDRLYFNVRLSGALRQKIDRYSQFEYISGVDSTVAEDSTVTVDSITSYYYKTTITRDGGAELVLDFRWKCGEKFNITSKATLFQALTRFDPNNPPLNNFWEYPDFKWESTITTKITSFLQFSYYFLLNYDREIDRKARFKQTLGAGLLFSFSNSN